MRLKREAFSGCIAKVAAQAGIDQNQAFGLLQTVADYGERLKGEGKPNPFELAAMELAAKAKKAAIDARTDALRNALLRQSILARANAAHAAGGLRAVTSMLRSLLVWDAKSPIQSSIESQWHALSKGWQSVVGNKVRAAGLERAAIGGQLDYEIGEAMWKTNIERAMETPGGKAPKRAPPDPKASPGEYIAQALHPALELVRARLNNAGASIGSAVDYVTHTSWDPRMIRRAAGAGGSRDAAFAAWWAKDGPRMSPKTFEHLVPRENETFDQAKLRFAKSLFDATTSGVHLTNTHLSGMADDGGGYIPPAYEGTHNIARSVSQQRVVYWKDSRAWVDHMRDFGGGRSIYTNVMHSLDGGARRVALMEKLGTNPEASFNTIVRKMIEQHRTDDDLSRFQSEMEGGAGAKTILSYLDGRANIPINADWAERLNQTFTWEATSKLGGVSLTHLAAAPGTVSAEMAHHGVGHLASIGHVLKAIVTGRGPAEKQEILAEAGAYAQGYNLMIHSKLNRTSGVPGYISWGAANFMRLTGLDHFLGRLQADGVKSVLMTKLGRQVDRPFDAIDPLQANLLKRYGIGPEEWELLRQAPETLAVGGQRYLTPKAADLVDHTATAILLRARNRLPLDATQAQVDTAVRKFKWELGDKYLMYLNDAAEHATVTPGARERAIMIRGARPGSLGWMLARSIGQFKMWPLAAWNQIVNREIGYSLSRKQMLANFGWLLSLSTAGGALRMSVNDMVNGRPQRSFDPTTAGGAMGLLAAMAQGGGIGIYGDFLFGEVSRSQADMLSTLGGPVLADLNMVFRIYKRFQKDLADGKLEDALDHMWPDLATFAKQHVPFANLIYIRGAVDYMLWYHLMEAASPGWWERTNRRLAREQGRTMLGYAPGAGIPYGVPGVYLGGNGRESGVLAGGSQ